MAVPLKPSEAGALRIAERARVAAHLDRVAAGTAHPGTRRGLSRAAAEVRTMSNPEPEKTDG